MDSRAEAPGVPALTPSDGGLTAFAKTKENLFDHETEPRGPGEGRSVEVCWSVSVRVDVLESTPDFALADAR